MHVRHYLQSHVYTTPPPWGRPMYSFIGLRNKTLMDAVCLTCVVWPQDFVNLFHAKAPPPGLSLNFNYLCESLYSPHSVIHWHQQEPSDREPWFCNNYTVWSSYTIYTKHTTQLVSSKRKRKRSMWCERMYAAVSILVVSSCFQHQKFWLAIFKSSVCDTTCLKLVFILIELKFTFTFNHS